MAIGFSVHCGIHNGPMKYSDSFYKWWCIGFDGIDGCDLYLNDEEAAEILAGRPLDRVAKGEFAITWEHLIDPPVMRITLYKELPAWMPMPLDLGMENVAEMNWQERPTYQEPKGEHIRTLNV